MAVMTAYNFLAPDAAAFRDPTLARIIFWHLPCAFISVFLLMANAYFGIRSLVSNEEHWDVRLAASTEMGAVLAGATMATGILFSKAQWDMWWNWDPRQTSFLMVLFLLALALALRGGFLDEKRAASVCGAYAVLSVLPSLFLVFVFPRLPQVERMSLHPSQTIAGGQMDTAYRLGTYGTMVALALVVRVLYNQRVRADLARLKKESIDGAQILGSDGASPDRVVRPVAVSQED